jgi:hypothetical protein
MTVFYVAPKVLGTHSATGATGAVGADVGRTQERSEQSAITEITSIHGVLHKVYCTGVLPSASTPSASTPRVPPAIHASECNK